MLGSGTLPDALSNFEKKFKDKSGLRWDDRGDQPKPKKYAYVERSYNPDSDDEADNADEADAGAVDGSGTKQAPAKCTLEAPVANLMKLIFNQSYFDATMSDLNYDANKLPLGKLSKGTIARGFQALKDLSVVLDNTDAASRAEVERLSDCMCFLSFLSLSYSWTTLRCFRVQTFHESAVEYYTIACCALNIPSPLTISPSKCSTPSSLTPLAATARQSFETTVPLRRKLNYSKAYRT